MIPLPIDPYLPDIRARVREHRAIVVTAEPGAGKTTRVPTALVEDGPVIVLQPRRVAARSVAARIAEERGWTVGGEVGWQIRFDRRFTDRTRLLVATEGVLTARLQRDPLLSGFATVVLDEFHERSIHADLAMALTREAWRARPDLRIVVMSATIDAEPVAAFLDGCPIVNVPGRTFPIDVRYRPELSVSDAVVGLMQEVAGDVLCFLPGAGEIRRACGEIAGAAGHGALDVLPLHASLEAGEQERALCPGPRRRVVVATNIAETSLTVPSVTAVVDSGLQKVARYDADRAIDSLVVERVTVDSADQRAGRAGREAPGIAIRLWDARDRLRPHREADIHRIDLSGPLLDVIAWGGDPKTMTWFEPPPRDALEGALALLERLGAVVGGRLTGVGVRMSRLPLHPRLGRMMVAAEGATEMARACALLSERQSLPAHAPSTSSDLLSVLDRWEDSPAHVRRVASDIERLVVSSGPRTLNRLDEASFRHAVLAGYPDRVARRRSAGSARVLLATGTGAAIGPESGVRDGEFVVALDLHAGSGRMTGRSGGMGTDADARIRIASRVEAEWLEPTATELVHRFDSESRSVKAVRIERYDALVLREQPVRADPDIAASLLADAWREGPRSAEDEQLIRRLRFAGLPLDVETWIIRRAAEVHRLDDLTLARALPPELRHVIERESPETILVPSGRRVRLEYAEDGTVSASVKLQELFGLADTPRVGKRREPVLLHLLAPNGRPVQVTRDLRSFWDRTYPQVRKELRGRYPRHPWPDDPWQATPTSRTKRRSGSTRT